MGAARSKTRHTRRQILTLAAIAGFLLAGLLPAAEPEQQVAYMDYMRNWHVVDAAQAARAARTVPEASQTLSFRAGGITFNVSYADVNSNNNIGFDDPALGSDRRATLRAVLDYIDSVLNESGACDIQVKTSETDGKNFLATGGPQFLFSGSTHFLGGAAFDHITTGRDPGQGTDINLTVNFGYNWNSDTGPVEPGETDLYSVLLHEVTHGLGFLSLSDSSGDSRISSSRKIFSFFDNNLYSGAGTKLWNSSGSFQADASVMVGADGGVRFRGLSAVAVLGSAPAVYTPSGYEKGSSMSHWNNTGFSPRPAMRPSIASGSENRTYQPFEIGALQDMGYATGGGGGGGNNPAAPFVTSARDTGAAGWIRVEWTHSGSTPDQFVASVYDIYAEEWVANSDEGTIWYTFDNDDNTGFLPVLQSGGHHVWVSSQYPDGQWLPSTNAATLIVQSAAMHKPTDVSTLLVWERTVRLKWKPDIYGTWTYWVIAYHIDSNQWIPLTGPLGESMWQYLVNGDEDFDNGTVDLVVPEAGQYFFFISAMGWDAKTMGEFGAAYAFVPNL